MPTQPSGPERASTAAVSYHAFMDNAERRRHWTVRVIRPGEDERAADREFWQRMTPDERVAVLWDMVLEARAWQGGHGDQPRLQRSVVRVQRP